jgi:hypothetical protein
LQQQREAERRRREVEKRRVWSRGEGDKGGRRKRRLMLSYVECMNLRMNLCIGR